MGADDDACRAARDLVAHLPLLLRRHGPGQQRHPGSGLVTAQLACHGQRPQHVPDRPGVLNRKDFRRRKQRALVAGIDHLRHREHRHDGLARPDLALQHPMHGLGVGELGGQHVEYRALTVGEVERQLLPQRREDAAVQRRCGRPGLAQRSVAARDQRPLQTDGLVERESPLRLFPVLRAFGEVDVAQRPVLRRQRPPIQQLLRQRVLDRIQHVENLAHAGVDVPALHLGTRRIDREVVPFERRDELGLVTGVHRLGHPCKRFGALPGTFSLEQQEPRVGELHGAAKVADLTRQHQLGAFGQRVLQVLGVEERGGDLRPRAVERHDHVFAARLPVGPAQDDVGDGAHERDVLAPLGQFVLVQTR